MVLLKSTVCILSFTFCLNSRCIEDKKWLVMQNLTGSFKKACVFDMKIGTIQHHDEMDEAKLRVAVDKCYNSTSGYLGMRTCGSKVGDLFDKTVEQED